MTRHYRSATYTVLLLLISGSACTLLRVKYLEGSDPRESDSMWRLTYRLEFESRKPGERLYINLPSNTAFMTVMSEIFSHRGLTIDMLQNTETSDREAVAVTSVRSEPVKFTAEFDINLHPDATRSWSSSGKVLQGPYKAKYLQSEKSIQKDGPDVTRILNELSVNQATKAELIESIFAYCSDNLIQSQLPTDPSDASMALRFGKCSSLGRARAMVALCRAAKIPARLVTGFTLEGDPQAKQFSWVEVYLKKNWIPYDPHNGYAVHLPPNYLPVKHGGESIVRGPKESGCRPGYSIERLSELPFFTGSSEGKLRDVLNLMRLPVSMKRTLSLVLLLPLGALVTSLFRNVVGIRTFGTFTPTLIALSLVSSDCKLGTMVLVVTLIIGLLCRMMLNRLKLLAVPRLGIILTAVVLCLVIGVSVFEFMGVAPTARSILLPVVIITMMIERFFITLEEDGSKTSASVLGGTVAVVICCFALLNSAFLGNLFLAFPEIQLLIAAAFIMIGRYSGYRLTELWRFRDLV